MPTDDEITQMTDLDPKRVDGVNGPANGAGFLVLKQLAEKATPVTHGIFSGTHSHAHDANGSQGSDASHTHDHSHADDGDHGHAHAVKASSLVECYLASIGLVVEEMAEKASPEALAELRERYPELARKADLSTAQLNDLPDSAFAYIEPGGSQDADGKTTPRSKRHFAVQDAAHTRAALARASSSPFGAKAMPKIKAAAAKFDIEVSEDASKSRAVKDLMPFVYDDDDLDPNDPDTPGSPPWEAQDAASLRDAASSLVSLRAALCNSQDRERAECMAGDEDDWEDVYDLGDALSALDFVLGIVARMSFTEAGEAQKAGRVLSATNESKLRDAVTALQGVLSSLPQPKESGDTAGDAEKGMLQVEITQQELDERIAAGVEQVLKARQETADTEAAAKAEADAKAAEEAAKAEGEGAPSTDSGEEMLSVLKAMAETQTATLEAMKSTDERLARIEATPMPGGPAANGVGVAAQRGANGNPVANDIETVQKAVDAESDPAQKALLGDRLTRLKLKALYSGAIAAE